MNLGCNAKTKTSNNYNNANIRFLYTNVQYMINIINGHHVIHMKNYSVDSVYHVALGMTLVSCIFLTAPGKVENIVVSARSFASLTVEWGAPSGGVKGYSVTLEGDGGDHQAEARDEISRSATFNSLSAGTEYIVRVVTLNGDLQSETAENKFYTST